jgi:PTH1 family peptidyl-tRNA hydrolase
LGGERSPKRVMGWLASLFRGARPSPRDDAPVKVILGLGNPGREYEKTRHNVGWWVIDHLADVWRFDGFKKDGESLVSSGYVGPLRVRLVKPLTYMNLSGSVLKPYLRRPTWNPQADLLVVVDDFALPLGTIRLRARGSAGGHNGLKSIEQALESQEYARLRIGIGPNDERRKIGKSSDFVLSDFGKAEAAEVRALFPAITEAIDIWVREGIEPAMNKHNRGTTA